MIADKIKWYKATRSSWCKENLGYKYITPKIQNKMPQIKKNVEIKPRLGQGRAGIKCKKTQYNKYRSTD